MQRYIKYYYFIKINNFNTPKKVEQNTTEKDGQKLIQTNKLSPYIRF